MRRNAIIWLTVAWLVLAMLLAAGTHVRGAPTPGLLKAITVSKETSADGLLLRIDGEYSFKTMEGDGGTVFIDLVGVRVARVPESGHWSGELLIGYRLLPYTDAKHQPVVRVRLEMNRHETVTAQKESEGLHMFFGQNAAVGSNSAPVTRALPPASEKAPTTEVTGKRPSNPSGGSTEVSGISITAHEDGGAVVDVLTARPTVYRVLHLGNPARVAVDLEATSYTGRQRSFAAQSPVLKGVRVGQFRADPPAVVRVVADLAGDPAFDVHAQPGGVRIELKPRGVVKQQARQDNGPAAPPPAPKVERKPAQLAPPTPPPVSSMEKSGYEASVRLPNAAAGKIPAAQRGPSPTAPTDYQKVLPAPVGSKEMTAAARLEPPAGTPQSLRAAQAVKILADDSRNISAAPQGQAPAGSAPAQETPKYTGEPISLNLKDVDLKDFFRLIHEISGLNIIVDPNVAGSVTLVLDSVPWDQALDIVLKNNRLDKVLEGNVLRVARIETLSAEQEETRKLAEARVEAQPLVTVFRPLSYAKGATMAGMLKSWVGGGALSKRGNILVDDRTNTLIISDVQSQIPVIQSVIDKLDKRAKQIAIEARIVIANASFARNLSSVLAAAVRNTSGTTIGSAATGLPNVSGAASGSGLAGIGQPPPLITTSSASGFGVFAIANASSSYAINAALGAAETKSQLRTISRPSIVTQNNVPGIVQQGAQIPIQTSINNTISIQYVNATLQLNVTPQVTDDGNIFMIIVVQNASPGPALTFAGPSINTQSANTQVLVPDGGTVVFGGVTVTQRSKSATYVPGIGNIPIIGHLFKTSSVADQDNELLFFVSPKVLPG